ncbi:GTPase IMAP family member 7-like [Amphiura filiformis]|uniref:GTPase IMAP family member 7-like n=1 Tax=Amphiura filiformis TaxID=82378 RepID=UPI003B228617
MHANHVIHRDIKGANCIIFEGNLLKLADFGIARYIAIDGSEVTSSEKGTRRYMAPEINSQNHFSFASDLYAYGMLAIEMVSGREPFEGSEWQYVVYQVVENNLRPDVPRDCPKVVAILMRLCWSKEPEDRPTADDIVHLLHSDNTPRFDALRLVVVGSQGAGTTAVSRRVIFRNDEKVEKSSALHGISRTCKRLQGEVFGTAISIVDTPEGLQVSDTGIKSIVAQVKFQSAPGPHAFLLVIRINSPPKTIRNTVAHLRRCFGENVCKHVVVLFTRGFGASEASLLPLSEYINRNIDVKQVLHDCGNRYIGFADTCPPDSSGNQDQVKQLMALINQMIGTNGGKRVKLSL